MVRAEMVMVGLWVMDSVGLWVEAKEGEVEGDSVVVPHWVVVPDPEGHWVGLKVPLWVGVTEGLWEELRVRVTLEVTEGLWEVLLHWVTLPVIEAVIEGLRVLEMLGDPDTEVVGESEEKKDTVALKLD